MPKISRAVERNALRRYTQMPAGAGDVPAPAAVMAAVPANVPGAPAPTDPTVSSRGNLPGDIVGGTVNWASFTVPVRSGVFLPVTVGLSGSPVKAKISPASSLGQATTNQLAIGLSPAEATVIGLTTQAQKAAFVAAVTSVGKIRPVL